MKFNLVLLLVILASCSSKYTDDIKSFDNVGIKVYFLNQDFESSDSVFVMRKILDNHILFTYDYHHLQHLTDSLKIYQDSIRFNNYRIYKLSDKEVIYKQKPIKITKYFSKQFTTSANIFVNDSLGLILTNNLASYSVVKYDTIKFDEIHKQIIEDSSFFSHEF